MNQLARTRGVSWIGITVTVVLLFLLVALLFPLLMQSAMRGRRPAHTINCLSNQRQIALASEMFAQDNNETMPGHITWAAGQIVGSHTLWVEELSLSSKVLRCPDSDSAMSYGLATDLIGQSCDIVPSANAANVLLSADAKSSPGSVASSADGLLFSRADINMTLHGNGKAPNIGFVASFLDGHVEFITRGNAGKRFVDAFDATLGPVAIRPGDVLYQGADHLFIIDGDKQHVSGKSFTSADLGRTQYFAFYYVSLPKTGQGITIKAPGGPVTLITPTQGKYYTILVPPIDIKHKITATLKGTTLTITNNSATTDA